LEAASSAGFVPNPLALIANGKIDTEIPASYQEIFMKQKSFAGSLLFAVGDTTSGEALAKDAPLAELSRDTNAAIPLCTCFWRRDMDYQPPSGRLDVGVCASGAVSADGTLDMRETGCDASYAEGWRRLVGTSNGPFCALELVSENGLTGRRGFWVRTGNRFAYAIGRPQDKDTESSLGCEPGSHRIAERTGKSLNYKTSDIGQSGLRQAWSYVAVVGEVKDDGSWAIESSTQPELVGCSLLGGPKELCCSVLTRTPGSQGYVQQAICPNRSEECIRAWRIVELNGCKLV
jgi:hypothetical protein